MMKIGIVEDEREHGQLLEEYLRRWAASAERKAEMYRYESAEAFLFEWEENKDFDLLFLDIQMPRMSGMELARRVRQESDSVGLIFTTGVEDFMQEGYEVSAIHYLLKPLSYDKVAQCLERACARQKKEGVSLLLHAQEGVCKVAADRIWWLEALGHHTRAGIGAEENGARIVCWQLQESMGTLEEQLPRDGGFVKCHRSYLVNLAHVCRIEKEDVVFDNGDRIPLSRRMYRAVNEQFIQYYKKKRIPH